LIKIIKTADGSDTLYSAEFDDHFHSVNGAATESMQVFIQNGFNAFEDKSLQINILEIGFGTGLNAYLTLREAISQNIRVYYQGIDLFPLPDDILQTLLESIKSQQDSTYFEDIHLAKWNNSVKIHDNFTLLKSHCNWQDAKIKKKIHCVYYDAFAPDKQPEMWTRKLIEKACECLISKGVFTTYTAKGTIRRMLQSIGLTVNRLPGPPGKREILQAIKY
jgi:tRNA U34 5-methylaminomethyl-2-thiouridine-forming methyltransferase MnmC